MQSFQRSRLFAPQILFDTDRQLQQAKSRDEMLDVTCTQLIQADWSRSIVAYVAENGVLSEGTAFLRSREALF